MNCICGHVYTEITNDSISERLDSNTKKFNDLVDNHKQGKITKLELESSLNELQKEQLQIYTDMGPQVLQQFLASIVH